MVSTTTDLRLHRRKPEVERRTYAEVPPSGATIIDGSARLIDADTDETVALHLTGREISNGPSLARAMRHVRWDGMTPGANEYRLSGICSMHRTFGTAPPVPLRRRYGCSRCRFDDEYPALTGMLADAARAAWVQFATQAPDEARKHTELTDIVLPAWRFGGTPWTSGIINNTAVLPYHRDAGNIGGSWSAMLALRRGVSGGLLHLADYDVWLAVPDRSLTIFDGQSILHAVTPLSVDGSGAYRYTVVWYAKANAVKCLDGDAEVRRAQRLRSEAEDRAAEAMEA